MIDEVKARKCGETSLTKSSTTITEGDKSEKKKKEEREYVFDIHVIDSDSNDSAGFNSKHSHNPVSPNDNWNNKASFMSETTTTKRDESKENISITSTSKTNNLTRLSSKVNTSINPSSKKDTSRKSGKKKPTVNCQSIKSFFKAKDARVEPKMEVITPVKKNENLKSYTRNNKANKGEPLMDSIVIENSDVGGVQIIYTPPQTKICSPPQTLKDNVKSVPDSPICFPDFTPTRIVNSTAIAGPSGISHPMSHDLSPGFLEGIPTRRRNSFRTSKHMKRKGSFSLESQRANTKIKKPRIIASDTDDSSDSHGGISPPLFTLENNTNSSNYDTNISGLTAEISLPVNEAIRNKYHDSSDNLDDSRDTPAVIPRPPSNLNFSEFYSPSP